MQTLAEAPASPDADAWLYLAQHDPTPVDVDLTYRSGWSRAVRVVLILAALPAVAVVSFMIPPHGEPLFVAVGLGLYLLYREASTQFVVRRFEGRCPRCGGELRLERGSRLTASRRIPCYGCHFHPVLVFAGPEDEA